MKKIILLLTVLLVTNFAQESENKELLTGNLGLDSKIAFEQTQEEISQQEIYLQNKKSPFLAALMSLAVPGAGDFYAGEYWKTAIFLAVEAVAITTAIIYEGKGDDQTESFENFANTHWSPQRYARWALDNATRINNNVDPTNYNVFQNDGSVNWSELNRLEGAIGGWFSHRLAARGDQQYYEMIGKYQQFNSGWDDFEEDPNDPFTFGDPLTEKFLFYSGERGKANDFYNVARWAVVGIVTNHIVSAVSAALSTNNYNKELEMKLNIKKEHIGFHTEYYPQLSLQLRF